MKHFLTWWLLVAAWHQPVRADLDSDAKFLSPSVVAQCRRALYVVPPSSDLPQPADRKRLASCDATALYYGIDQDKNVRDARLCAYLEAEEQRGRLLGGEQVLVSIYANAEGIERNLELARRYACANYMAPAELENLLKHIAAIETDPVTTKPLVYCDEITSGYMTGACADLADRGAELKRTKRATVALGHATAAQRRAWQALRKALQHFAEEHADNEVDLSGSARGAFMVQAEAELTEEFTRLLELLASRQKPTGFGMQPLAASERALLAAFRAGTLEEVRDTTVTAEGVRRTQRAWLAYRSAWLAFARVRFPDLADDPLSAWLADRRTHQLETLGALPSQEVPQL